MTGPELKLAIKPGATPTCHTIPHRVPLHWKEQIEEGLKRDIKMGIIEELPPNTPAKWCHKMVVTSKPGSTKPRRTVDMSALKTASYRLTHPGAPPFLEAQSVPADSYKTVTDAWQGFHMIPLHEDSRQYTTFVTEWGMFRYKRMPMGDHVSMDAYNYRFDKVTDDVENKKRCVDDSLLYTETLAHRLRTLDRSLAPPPRPERKFSGERVCRVTFKQLPQPLRSHILSYGTLVQLFKKTNFSTQILMSDGTKDPNIPEADAAIDDKSKLVTPSANAAVAGKTSYKASKMGVTRSNPPEMAGEIIAKKTVTKAAVRQPKGECDPESDLPCSCPRRVFVEPPDKLPMPATASNRKVLEEYIKNHFKAWAFNTCKRQHSPITAGPPMKIHTPPDAPRTYCRRPTKVPLHFREEVKPGLESDVKKGVLERVPVGEADTWCSRMVIQPKKNGRARRTVDLSGLSKAGRHESHHTRSAAEIVKTVPTGKLKSTLDCVDGYHGVELAEEDSHKTTFASEWGLFRYLRVPQGYLSSGDSYTKHTDAILVDCPEKPSENDYEKIVDDIIQWSETMEQSFFRICSLLSHCNKNGMVFSPEKFMFAKETVEFAGFEITLEGIRPTDKYIEAIRNFPTPTNISEVRSWFGLINQVAYSFVKTEHMAPFRHLLSQSQTFVWDKTMETAFRMSKERIIELIVEGVASFDVNLVTCLSPDYSKQGMGWILQQKTCSCPEVMPTCCTDGWRLVLAGGHFCNPAEQNYSPIEGEATAVARGLHDTKYYTMGCNQLYVATHHKSLVCVLGDQSLADVENPRLARIKEKTLWWQFTIVHTPSKLQLAADALSRRKTKLPATIYQLRIYEPNDEEDEVADDLKNRFEHHFPEPDTSDLTEEETAAAYSILNSEEISVITWERLYEVANEDWVLVS
jgi:hypothetical protein